MAAKARSWNTRGRIVLSYTIYCMDCNKYKHCTIMGSAIQNPWIKASHSAHNAGWRRLWIDKQWRCPECAGTAKAHDAAIAVNSEHRLTVPRSKLRYFASV